VDAPVSAAAPLPRRAAATSEDALAPPYDVDAEIRKTLPGQRRHLPRLRASARALARFAREAEPSVLAARLRPRFAALAAALLGSPAHVQRMRQAGLSPRDLRGPEDLVHFPLLDRAALRDHRDAFVSLAGVPEPGLLVLDRTSGSSGRPLCVFKDEYDTLHPWAVLRFLARWHGVRLPPRPRVALLCALPHGVEYSFALPALGGGVLTRISAVRPGAAARLADLDPHVLYSDPAGLHWLDAQPRRPRPRLVLSSGQYLPPARRATLERRLGLPVVNYYSTTETGPIGWECGSGRFHVLHPDVWVESVEGRIVVTRLRPSVLPLLRYRTEDDGAVVDESCRCGYRGRSVVGFRGRRACRFVTPDGRGVDAWALASVFKHQPLAAFQVSQVGPRRFRVAVSGRTSADFPVRLEATLARLGFPEPLVEIEHAERPSAAASKPAPFRFVPWE
jgi:phenylacetate-CoA ligase